MAAKQGMTTMNRRFAGLAAGTLLAAGLGGCIVIESTGGERVVVQSSPTAMAEAPDAYAAIVADPSRPAADVERDAARHPADILAFARVAPGDRAKDVMGGLPSWLNSTTEILTAAAALVAALGGLLLAIRQLRKGKGEPPTP